jgi:hypothetical protein
MSARRVPASLVLSVPGASAGPTASGGPTASVRPWSAHDRPSSSGSVA